MKTKMLLLQKKSISPSTVAASVPTLESDTLCHAESKDFEGMNLLS